MKSSIIWRATSILRRASVAAYPVADGAVPEGIVIDIALGSGVVDVPVVIDVRDGDGALGVIDAVDDAVRPSPSAVPIGERRA